MVVPDAKTFIAFAATAAVLIAGCGLVLFQPGDDLSDSILMIGHEGIYENGTYSSVVISPEVGDGHVVLRNITILGSLTVNGGGSGTVVLEGCDNRGTTTVDKTGGQPVRILLKGTELSSLDAASDLILEGDSGSSFGTVSLKDSKAVVQGSETSIASIGMGDGTELDVKEGTVSGVSVPAECSATVRTGAGCTLPKIDVAGAVTVDGEDTGIGSVVMNDGASLLVRKGAVSEIDIPLECSATLQADARAAIGNVSVSGKVSVEGSDTVVSKAVLKDNASVSVSAGTVDSLEVPKGISVTVTTESGGLVRAADVNGTLNLGGAETRIDSVTMGDGSSMDVGRGEVAFVSLPAESSAVLRTASQGAILRADISGKATIDGNDTRIESVGLGDSSTLLVAGGTVSEVIVPSECSAVLRAEAAGSVDTLSVSGAVSIEGAQTAIARAVLNDGSSVSVLAGSVAELSVSAGSTVSVRTGADGIVKNAEVNGALTVDGTETRLGTVVMNDGSAIDILGGEVGSLCVASGGSVTFKGRICEVSVAGSITVDGEDTGIGSVLMGDGASLYVREGNITDVIIPAECSASVRTEACGVIDNASVSGGIILEGQDTAVSGFTLSDGSSVSVGSCTLSGLVIPEDTSVSVSTFDEGIVRNIDVRGTLNVTGSDTRIENVNLEDGSAVDVKAGTVDSVNVAKDSSITLDKSDSAVISKAVVGDNVSIDASDDTDLSSVYISMSEDAEGDVVRIKDRDVSVGGLSPGSWWDWWKWWWGWAFLHGQSFY